MKLIWLTGIHLNFLVKSNWRCLMQTAQENNAIEFMVLCGHTHSKAYWQPRANLTVKAGSAEYTKPEIQEILKL